MPLSFRFESVTKWQEIPRCVTARSGGGITYRLVPTICFWDADETLVGRHPKRGPRQRMMEPLGWQEALRGTQAAGWDHVILSQGAVDDLFVASPGAAAPLLAPSAVSPGHPSDDLPRSPHQVDDVPVFGQSGSFRSAMRQVSGSRSLAIPIRQVAVVPQPGNPEPDAAVTLSLDNPVLQPVTQAAARAEEASTFGSMPAPLWGVSLSFSQRLLRSAYLDPRQFTKFDVIVSIAEAAAASGVAARVVLVDNHLSELGLLVPGAATDPNKWCQPLYTEVGHGSSEFDDERFMGSFVQQLVRWSAASESEGLGASVEVVMVHYRHADQAMALEFPDTAELTGTYRHPVLPGEMACADDAGYRQLLSTIEAFHRRVLHRVTQGEFKTFVGSAVTLSSITGCPGCVLEAQQKCFSDALVAMSGALSSFTDTVNGCRSLASSAVVSNSAAAGEHGSEEGPQAAQREARQRLKSSAAAVVKAMNEGAAVVWPAMMSCDALCVISKDLPGGQPIPTAAIDNALSAVATSVAALRISAGEFTSLLPSN